MIKPGCYKAATNTVISRFTLAYKLGMPVTLEPGVAGHIAGLMAEMAVILDAIQDAVNDRQKEMIKEDEEPQ